MVNITVFASFDQVMTQFIITFMRDAVNGLSAWISGPFKAAALLYIVIYGYMVLTGAVAEPIGQFIRNCIRIAAVAFLIDAGHYTSYVSDLFFTTLPNEVGSAINSRPVDASSFDSILNAAGKAATDIGDQMQSLSPSTYVYALLALMVLIAGLFVAVTGYIVAFIAKMGLSLVLALGPVFVAMYLFEATRRFTDAFIGQLANYVTLQVLVVALGTLIITTLKGAANVGSVNDVMSMAVIFSATCMVSAILFYQLPGIAASLAAGGSQIALNLPGRTRA